MDVEGVTCVVNYDPPRQYQTYLHRAGRTARAGQKGVVFTLLSREEVSGPRYCFGDVVVITVLCIHRFTHSIR